MIPDAVKTKLERCPSLPTMPALALRVLSLCQRDDLDLGDIAKAISSDPALAAKVLKMANSAVMGLRSPAKTISHCVALLGVTTVRTAALSFSLVGYLRKAPTPGLDNAACWKRSIVAALAAQELATSAGARRGDEAFLGALLQDVGVLALFEAKGKQYVELAARAEGSHARLLELERSELGCDHAEVGAWLLGRWKLPDLLVEIVGSSHSDSRGVTEAPESEWLGPSVALSGWLADIWVGSDAAAATQIAGERAGAILGWTGERLEPVLRAVASALSGDMAKLFDLTEADVGSPDEITAILEQAKETLVLLTWEAEKRAEQATSVVSEMEVKNQELREESQRDKLTRVYNRERLNACLSHELRLSNVSGKPLSVLFCDVDHFKKVNDEHGHVVGDAVLVAVAQALGHRLRQRDVLARYGGEEFVIVLPETPVDGARVVAERLRQRIESTEVDALEGRTLSVTASFGIAAQHDGLYATPADLLDAADQALYSAKHTGRNRSVFVEEMADRAPTARRACIPDASASGAPPQERDLSQGSTA